MNKYLLSLLLLMITFCNLQAKGIEWHKTIEDAMNEVTEDKHVFVFFTGSDWCTWCHRLNQEVFDHKFFQDYVAENMEMVLLDFPRKTSQEPDQKAYNEEKMMQYGVRGFPSVIILDNNGEVAMQLGYREGGPEAYVDYIESVLHWKPEDFEWEDEQGQVWFTNLEKAIEAAEKEDKYILVNFTGSDWCTWCHRLRDEVFLQPEFADFAYEELVLLRLDFPKRTKLELGEEAYNMSLLQRFGVRGFPTIFLLDSSGDIIKKLGYQEGGAQSYISMLEGLIN